MFHVEHNKTHDDMEKTYYVPYSALFNATVYDVPKIEKVLRKYTSVKNIRLACENGLSNQPDVVVFDCPDECQESILSDLMGVFNSPWVRLDEVTWENWWKKNTPIFKVVCIDETKDWKDEIQKKAGKIHTYFLVDTANTDRNSGEYVLSFLYHRVSNFTNYYDEDTMTEEQVANGQDELTELEMCWEESEDGIRYEKDIEQYIVVHTCELPDWYEKDPTLEDYVDLQEHIIDYIKGNPVELLEANIAEPCV